MLLLIGCAVCLLGLGITLVSPFSGLLFYWAWFLIRPQEIVPGLGGGLPLERFLAIALVISLVLHRKLRRTPITDPVFLAMVGFLLVNYLSVLTSIWKSNSLHAADAFFKVVVFAFCAINLLETTKQIEMFLWVYVLGVGEEAISAIYNYSAHPYFAQGIHRATSFAVSWQDPNTTSTNLVLSLVFLFVLARSQTGWFGRSVAWGLIAANLICIVLTGSRIGWLLLLFTFLGMALRSRRRILLVPAFVVVLVTAWTLIPAEYQQRYRSISAFVENPVASTESQEASAYGRVVGFMVSLKIFADHPILGVGADNFADAFWSLGYSYAGQKGYFQPHNLPGQVLSELGILGAISFGYYVILLLRKNRMIGRHLTNTRSPLLSGINAAIWILVPSLILHGFTSHNMYRYNWYLAGIMLVASRSVLLGFRNQQASMAGTGAPSPEGAELNSAASAYAF